MQKVETIEPYDRTTAKWVEKVEEVETPKTVRKKIEYTAMKKVPYTVRMRVPVDCFGNAVGKPEPVDPKMRTFFSSTNRPSATEMKKVEDSDLNRRPSSFNVDPEKVKESKEPSPADLSPALFGSTKVAKPMMETHSVLVPETKNKVASTPSLKTLLGPPLEIKTPLKSLRLERTPAESVGSSEIVETSLMKPAVKSPVVKAEFNRDLIEAPSVPNIAPRTFDVQGIDKMDELKRRSITEIY